MRLDLVRLDRVMEDLMESGFELIFHSHVILQSFDSRVRALKPEFCKKKSLCTEL